MSGRLTPWLLGGLIVLAGTARAQTPPAGEEKTKTKTKTTTQTTTTTTTEGTTSTMTVRREEVRTWVVTVHDREYEAHPATPAYEGETGLFHMSTAYTLPRGKFSFSLFRDNLDRDPKDMDISIHGVSLGFGATDRLELHGNFGWQNRVDTDALFQAGFVNDYPFASTPWQTGAGDVKLGLKYGFLNDYLGDALGLALRGFVKIGTADKDKGLGTGKPSVGLDLVLSKSINHAADIHGSIGYQWNSDPDRPSSGPFAARPGQSTKFDIANAFKWAIGLNVPACTRVQLQAELMGTKYVSKPAGFLENDPLDLVAGPVVWLGKGIFIRPALSVNLNFNKTGLDSEGRELKSYMGRHLSIGYYPGFACREIAAPPPPPPPPPANRNPSVVCEVERSTVKPGESVRVRATASDPDGDPLTYEWRASAGRITGTGSSVTWDSTGVTPPATVTITVRVSDGRGGTAESTCTVRMEAPAPPPAAAVTCISAGFPPNLARLTNVDKACLDDVASRLRQDPRSRVIIIGHADAGERTPEVIARRRAEEAKNYLVKERGIDESRISVRSAAATKPVDTGKTPAARARNRRVEVIFVPEGATVPEMDE